MNERVVQALGIYRYCKATIIDLEQTKVNLRNNDNPLLMDVVVEIGITTIDGIIGKIEQDIAQLEVAIPDLILLYNERDYDND